MDNELDLFRLLTHGAPTPQIIADESVPKDEVWFVPPRRGEETLKEWRKRCVVVVGVGEEG